jgi:putative component of membrane protein insertase Oxa1/YidC/SpoIIIJ protein YidD
MLPTLIIHEGIVAVRAPLHFLGARPFPSSLATGMPDINGTCWAKGPDKGVLWVSLLDIHELCTRLASNSNGIAIATRVAMSFVLVIQLDLGIFVRSPLHFLSHTHCPFESPCSTGMCNVIRSLRAISTHSNVRLWILPHNVNELDLTISLLCVPKSTVRKVPTCSAWLVTAVEVAGLGWIFVISRGLICPTILEDHQSPSGTRVAITIDSITLWFGTNYCSTTWLRLHNPAEGRAIDASLSLVPGQWGW